MRDDSTIKSDSRCYHVPSRFSKCMQLKQSAKGLPTLEKVLYCFYINHLELKIVNPVVVTGPATSHPVAFSKKVQREVFGGANSNLQNCQPLRTRNLHETSGPWQVFLVNTSENLLNNRKIHRIFQVQHVMWIYMLPFFFT